MSATAKSENRQVTDKPKRAAPKSAFKKGASGNPGGRPKKTEEEFELERACEAKVPEALDTIIELMRTGQSDKVRMNAAAFIIERKYGKAIDRKEVRTGTLEDMPDDALTKLLMQKAKEAGLNIH